MNFWLGFRNVFNFWIASRFVGFGENRSEKKDLVKYLHDAMQRVYIPLSILISLPIALPMFLHWEEALLFLFGAGSGVTDPLLGKDISFYLFSLPVYSLIQKELILALVVLFAGVLFLYWYEHRLLAAQEKTLPRGARLHVAVLALAIVGILCWGAFLERYGLLYETTNLPVFHGPGYVEMRIILPLIWLTVILIGVTGTSLVVCFYRRSGWKMPVASGILLVLCLLGKNAEFFTDAVRKYISPK